MTSIFSPFSSRTMLFTREPAAPTRYVDYGEVAPAPSKADDAEVTKEGE